MEHLIQFTLDDSNVFQSFNEDYDIEEFAIAKIGFLSSRPNSHGLVISNEVLKKYAKTVLGKFLVAKVDPITEDATTHSTQEIIYGYFPKEQEIEFKEEDNNTIRAFAYAVISKVYTPELYEIFERKKEKRSVSVEMTMTTENDLDLNDTVLSFNIVGVTVLGKAVLPSCPESEIVFVRFSEKQAEDYFVKHKDKESGLQKFAKERRKLMEDKYVNHPIDTSKEAIDDGDWDGDKAKQDLVKEEKFETLAPKVCLRLEDGWKNREVTKLGYPVMCLSKGKWVYSRKGLSSALGYAKQHNDDDIVKKVEAIYKKLGLDSDGKEESAKMAEIEFSAVNIGDMWSKLNRALHEKYPDGEYWSVYVIDSIWEENNKKFAVIHHKDEDIYYRLDFDYTENGIDLADEIVKVEMEIVETDTIRKFAKPDENQTKDEQDIKAEMQDDVSESKEQDKNESTNNEDEDEDAEMSCQRLQGRISELEKELEDKNNIIMEKDTELEDLRKFKSDRLELDKSNIVSSVLASISEFVDAKELESFKAEGLACQFECLDAWSNKIKASVVDKALKHNKKNTEFTRIAGNTINNIQSNPSSVWDKIILD